MKIFLKNITRVPTLDNALEVVVDNKVGKFWTPDNPAQIKKKYYYKLQWRLEIRMCPDLNGPKNEAG